MTLKDTRECIEEYKYNIITQVSKHQFQTLRNISFILPNGDIVFIPKGFLTNLASTPRLFWNLIPPYGEYTIATVIHDYLYETGYPTRDTADQQFRVLLYYCGVPYWKKTLMYLGTKYFGKSKYKNYK